MKLKLESVSYFFPFFWIFFFNDNIEYNYGDWFTIILLKIYKYSLSINTMPYQVNFFENYIFFDKNFFSNLWLPITPQIILLKFISIKSFLLIQTVFISIICVRSFLLWKKKLKFSLYCLFILIPSWIFGGFIVTRFAVGHWMFIGFLLIPLLFYILNNMINLKKNNKNKKLLSNSIYLGLIMSFALMQGHLHFIYHVSILLVLICFFFSNKIKYFILSFFVFFLTSLHTLLPKIFFSSQASSYINSNRMPEVGYSPSLLGIPSSEFDFENNSIIFFIYKNVKNFIDLLILSPNYENNIWEKTLFIGLITTLLIFFGLFFFSKQIRISKKNIKIFFIFLIFSLLSIYNFHFFFIKILQNIFYFFPAVDKISSKFFLYSLFFLLIISLPAIDKFLINHKIFYCLLILLSNAQILNNLFKWSLSNSKLYFEKIEDKSSGFRKDYLKLQHNIKVLEINDYNYVYLFNSSILLSFVFISLFILFCYKLNKK